MNSHKSKSLSWNDRIAIIDQYNPTDEKIVEVFGVTSEELETARDLVGSGILKSTPDIDLESYGYLFGQGDKPKVTRIRKPAPQPILAKPQTATKPTPKAKKRGRKGDEIAIAYGAITTTPTSANEFSKEYNVSVAVLRQSKRFDTCPEKGYVRVKKDKDTKVLLIFRETEESTK